MQKMSDLNEENAMPVLIQHSSDHVGYIIEYQQMGSGRITI